MWWWMYSHEGPQFTWLGAAHIMVGVFLVLICALILFGRKWLRTTTFRKNRFRFSCVTVFLLGELTYQWWLIDNGVWDISFALPLHLSSIAWITATLMLFTKRQLWFEIAFFAGVGSAVLTLVTPDVGNYGFPHFRFFHFFITHGLVIVAVVYMLAVEKATLRFRAVFRVWILLNGYAALMFGLNLLVDGNYMYLMQKPVGPSPFDWFGPWPYYILVLQGVAFLVFLIMYGGYWSAQKLVQKVVQ